MASKLQNESEALWRWTVLYSVANVSVVKCCVTNEGLQVMAGCELWLGKLTISLVQLVLNVLIVTFCLTLLL